MPVDNHFKEYLVSIEQSLRAGNATEHTYRPALKTLIESVAAEITGDSVHAINEPKRVECGAPDFIIARGTVPLGYIETKDVGEDLRRVEKSSQLKRYREALTNLILTDYIHFRWYVNGELKLEASLPRPGMDGRMRWNEDSGSQVRQLLEQFLNADIPVGLTPEDLATRMAGMGRLIRQLIDETFKQEEKHGELHIQLNAFRKVLIESLTSEQFADMYAQTLCYGLFAARCNAPAGTGFTRQSAANALPKTNPFLRKLFNSIAGPDLDDRIAWAVDQLAVLLARANMKEILRDFGRHTRREDPVVHFYETFLAAYDPKLREARGVYYTPEPVVGYIVRSVDELLKREFNMPDGLADASKVTLTRRESNGKKAEKYETHRLQILDPATGTGTFLYAVIDKIREHFNGNEGAWPGYVAEHLLPRIFGFELLMAPYAVAHMKLGLQLQETGYDFQSDQRLGVYLTNSLEEAHEMTDLPLFTQWLAEESCSANEIKRDAPVMVVLGNPPYSGESENSGEWVSELMRGRDTLSNQKTANYFEVDGQPLGERNPKWLNNDYVKFIRFAQWRIEQTGYGILAFVTSNSYLDSPTFRGMRESLVNGFDEIYILDLHGNSNKHERAPDGGKDVNVFDIKEGVAIGIFVLKQSSRKQGSKSGVVYHADIYGTREAKYKMLEKLDLGSTKWEKNKPITPHYYYTGVNTILEKEYTQFPRITDFMPLHSLGITTSRDSFSIAFDQQQIVDRVSDFLDLGEEEARIKYQLGPDARDWKVTLAQADLNNLRSNGKGEFRTIQAEPILYRPFDRRFTIYTGKSRGFHSMPRQKVMQHMLKPNLALDITRGVEINRGFEHVFVSKRITTLHTTSLKEVNYHIPLWRYEVAQPDLLDTSTNRHANFSDEFILKLTSKLGSNPSPPEIMAYIYAILYSPTYRTRYADFLKRDFPRIPITSNKKLFQTLAGLGQKLIELHTMEKTLPRITQYPVVGSNEVARVRFAQPSETEPVGRVFINNEQFFDNVPLAVWETHIGGYRVAEKWLKDRKGRELGYDDLTHYQGVIAALARTLEVQAEIDVGIDSAGGWPLS